MEVIVKKSTELSEMEFQQISRLFEDVFEKSRSVELFYGQYEQNPFGYAWLSMLVEGGCIVGLNSYVPSYYVYNGKKLIFANSIDSMVKKPYRDFFNFNDMIHSAYKVMAANGVAFVYGYPNDNSYPVLTKAKLMKDIGKMRIYCLPLHIGGIKRSLKILNPISELICRLFTVGSGFFASSSSPISRVRKDETSYNQSRYKRGEEDYKTLIFPDGLTVYYKIKDHEGVRTAFLIDLTEKTPKAFNKAVKYIISNHRKEFDLLLYPGWLNFVNTSMFRLPRKFEPKNFNFTGKILDKNVIGNDIWDIRNWDTNLSNYDLI